MKQFNQKPDDTDLPKEKPATKEEWPEDDVAEKYIKKETPSEEEDEEVNRTLKEARQPKK